MKLLLCIALLLLETQLSESACYFQEHNTGAARTCFDTNDGTVHQYGESWINSNCHSCVCSAHGYECCARYFEPTGYSNDCTVSFDLKTCLFRVHSKKDPSVDCAAEGAIGK